MAMVGFFWIPGLAGKRTTLTGIGELLSLYSNVFFSGRSLSVPLRVEVTRYDVFLGLLPCPEGSATFLTRGGDLVAVLYGPARRPRYIPVVGIRLTASIPSPSSNKGVDVSFPALLFSG